MANTEKLKRRAAEFEQKKQYDRALQLYVEALDESGPEEDRDVPLYNRVGDLFLRQGNVEQAVTYYEKAVDFYAEGGYQNNAIALCNKILRHSPGRSSIYYKLGKISASKGFNSDAKQNFLEYADRMQKMGRMDEAFRALEEFADLCPGQDDIRLLLAEQLSRAGRRTEALEQLQILHEALDAGGRTTEAQAAAERIRAIDPDVEPRRSITPLSQSKGGLVFLDLDEAPVVAAPVEGLEPTALSNAVGDAGVATRDAPQGEAGIEASSHLDGLETLPVADHSAPPMPGLEPTALTEELFHSTDESALSGITPQRADPETVDFAAPPVAARSAGADDDHFVDLADWLREDDGPRSTRMVASDDRRSLEGQADFSEMLQKFKEGVAANVEEEDADSHYDLGVAYREMGLLDEAISEFQTALRGDQNRVRAYEALGQCFVDKGELDLAVSVLSSSLREQGTDDHELIGILYLLGVASDQMGKTDEAATFYKRVVAVDIDFRDARSRLRAVER